MKIIYTAIALTLFLSPLVSGKEPNLKTSSVNVNGVEIAYRIGGKGEPLLLLHGFTGAGVTWDAILEPLLENNQVIIPDLRGHGQSTNPSGKFYYKDSAKDMLGLLDHLNIDHVSGIGYSAGAVTLLHMTAENAERFNAVVLLAGAHRLTSEVREWLRNFPRFEDLSVEHLERLRKRHARGDEQSRMLWRQLREFADDYTSFEFSPEHLATIKVRSLLVVGDMDQFYPVPIVTELYEFLPNASLWIIPGADHDYVAPHYESIREGTAFFSGNWWPPMENFLFDNNSE